MMKKTGFLFLLALIILACHRKTVAVAPPVNTQPAVPETSSVDNSKTELITQGKTVYINRCGRCHGLKPVGKFTETEWMEILKFMIPKARLNDVEGDQVRAYVREFAKKSP